MQTFMRLGSNTRLVGSVSRAFVKQRSTSQLLKGEFKKLCIAPVRAVAAEPTLQEEPAPAEPENMTKSFLLADDPAAMLAGIRKEMKAANVKAYIVPSEDPHMSEYPPDCCNRRVFVSGFTGSAGTAVVTEDKAFLWTDGRYFLQATEQLTADWTLMRMGDEGVLGVPDWLAENLPEGSAVGIDALVHTMTSARELESKLTPRGVKLACVEDNLVDKVWDKRPEWPKGPTRIHKLEHAGKSVSEKLTEIRAKLSSQSCDAMLLTDLAEIAWTFNMRGGDVECNPVFVAYATVGADSATLYMHEGKVGAEVQKQLEEAGVTMGAYDDFPAAAAELAKGGAKLWLNPSGVSWGIYQKVLEAQPTSSSRGKRRKTETNGTAAGGAAQPNVLEAQSPVQNFKAIKNEPEKAGMREAHLRDAVALCEHFSWFEERMEAGEKLTEVALDEHLTSCRAAQEGHVGPSFPTIAGCNGNGAIIHYRAEPETCKTIDNTCMLLVDSGGQYDCGTTDITRTFHFGTPSSHQKAAYTRVLQGHIALDTAVFPEGTPGFVLDAFARMPLWKYGLNYRHGTGHGVGAALNVHEGPQGISFRYNNQTPLEVDMIVSNEPGYYEDGNFGVRIENLAMIVEASTQFNFAGKTYMTQEPITFVPIETKLMDTSIMTDAEIEWVNQYHDKCIEKVKPRLEAAGGQDRALAWLEKKAIHISK